MVVQTGLFDLFGLYTPLRMLICVAVVFCLLYIAKVQYKLVENRFVERTILHVLYGLSNAVDEPSQRNIL